MLIQNKNTPFYQKKQREHGGVALEYVIVTTFAALASTALLTVMGTVAKEKIHEFTAKLHVDVGEVNINPFGDE